MMEPVSATMWLAEGNSAGEPGLPAERKTAVPDFDNAQVQVVANEVDLATYVAFLKGYTAGSSVTVPLEQGEKKRVVMRHFNRAAAANGQKLFVLKADESTVAFRIVRPSGPRKSGLSSSKPVGRPRKVAKATA